jgi:hypothetical protein
MLRVGQGDDYVLDGEDAWIKVKGFAVRITKTDEGVVVDVYKDGETDGGSIASTYAFDAEIEGF